MPKVKDGDTVKIHYTGTLKDGTKFDTSVGGEPIQFKVGEGRLIPGFEQAVVGLAAGDKKTFTIPFDEAYGPRRDELIVTVDRNQIPPEITPVVGEDLVMEREDSHFNVRVVEVTDDIVTLDANHQLAGEDLVFDVELIEIA
jgi:peptidylprolyl isomerase